MVLDQILTQSEEVGGEEVENSTLIRDRFGHNNIKGGDPIGTGDEEFILELIDLPNLPLLNQFQGKLNLLDPVHPQIIVGRETESIAAIPVVDSRNGSDYSKMRIFSWLGPALVSIRRK